MCYGAMREKYKFYLLFYKILMKNYVLPWLCNIIFYFIKKWNWKIRKSIWGCFERPKPPPGHAQWASLIPFNITHSIKTNNTLITWHPSKNYLKNILGFSKINIVSCTSVLEWCQYFSIFFFFFCNIGLTNQ